MEMRLLPLAAAAATLVGAQFIRREWLRINRDLDRVRAGAKPLGTLRRDEKTGEWRPSR
jgi:hypothetical protein